jgi:nucleotide-binding universal stress UspA family protein
MVVAGEVIMSVFNSILVGIDLMHGGGTDPSSFSRPVEEAIKNGLWLAEKASAKLTFFAGVDLPEDQVRALESGQFHEAYPHLQAGIKAMRQLVESARQRGLDATAKVVSGHPWAEIIREVERAHHDVVIIGTRNVGTVQRLLFGSTAMSLLHNCPCPVWVTRPEQRPLPHNILVTTDFSPVSDITLKLGLALGQLSGAKVHVLHSVDFVVDRKYSVGLMYHNADEYHVRAKSEALEQLADQLARVTDGQPPAHVELHIGEGESIADTAILNFIDKHDIDLLLMGTIARGGISGVSIGNTAERLVTHVNCSMIAVKPTDFKCPIHATPAKSHS